MADPAASSRLTVRGVLRLDLIASYEPEVAAGAEGLDRPVRWVHVAEAPTSP
jgi:purine catabolism regulator